MRAIMLRGIDEATYSAVKKFSQKAHTSMNKFIINLVKNKVGITQKETSREFDEFFGTWNERECRAFMETTKSLRKIDKELWN